MKIAAEIFINRSASVSTSWAPWNAIMMIKAFLKTLSLKAPKNCVTKNGKKRLWVNSSNCPAAGLPSALTTLTTLFLSMNCFLVHSAAMTVEGGIKAYPATH
jgi:hypothetical protein